MCRRAGHGQQSSEVGVGRVQREAQRSALEVDEGRGAGTFRREKRTLLKKTKQTKVFAGTQCVWSLRIKLLTLEPGHWRLL